jgi:hypothetical protein
METNHSATVSEQGCRIRKRTLRDLADTTVTYEDADVPKELKEFLKNLPVTGFSYEDAMHKKQIMQALEGDTRAYLAVMDMLYSKKITGEQDRNKPNYVIIAADSETARLMEEV